MKDHKRIDSDPHGRVFRRKLMAPQLADGTSCRAVKRSVVGMLFLLACSSSVLAGPDPTGKKIVLLAGKKSHGPGAH